MGSHFSICSGKMFVCLQVTPEVLKARQRAKAQAWEMELKAKKKMVPPMHLGCFWLDNPCVSDKHLDILKQFEVRGLLGFPCKKKKLS